MLEITDSLAQRFHAGVVGIATCQPMQSMYNDGSVPPEIIERDREEIKKSIEIAEAEFRTALGARVSDIQWRPMMMFGPLSDCVADEARSADLVIASMDQGGSLFDAARSVNVGDLVMRVGRPVLVVPTVLDKLELDRVVVGWKDTREARRAIVDALPFLKSAARVAVVEIADGDELAEARSRLDDVVAWLKRHDVTAESIAFPSTGRDPNQLNAIAREQGANLIVAGAYGHNRLREWVFGGMTKDLLLSADRCSLVSH